MTNVAAHVIALVAFAFASVIYGATLALRTPERAKSARILFCLGVVAHTCAIGAFCIETHRSPFESGFGTLSVTAWAVALVYIPIEILGKTTALGALASPVVSVLLFAGLIRARSGYLESSDVRSSVINFHVLLALFSLALFALAACSALLYVWQYSSLKHPDARGLFRRLPPLEYLDRLSYHLVSFAMPLLTLAIALGIVRAASTPGASWIGDPHTIISFVVWAVHAAYLFARLGPGWRGTKLNWLLVAGLGISVLLSVTPSTTHRYMQKNEIVQK